MSSKAFIIAKKELMRVFGDRKLLFSLYIFPAVLVIVIFSLMGNMIGSMESDITEHVANVSIVNGTDTLKNITKLTGYDTMANISWIDENEYNKSKENLEKDVLEGNSELIVYLAPDFEKTVSDYSGEGDEILPVMNIFYNNTEDYSSQAYAMFSSVVSDNYQTELLSQKFGNAQVLNAYKQNAELIFKEEKANTQFISMMLPYLIVLLLFAGVMSIGVDAIAGEKERGTLSSMLISPVKRRDIVVGKLVSMAILSSLTAITYSISMIIAMTMMGKSGGIDEMGFGNVSFNVLQCIELLLTMLAIVYLYVGVVGLLATIAKDTKAAQSLISPCYIVVVILGVLTMFTGGKEISTVKYLIPVYGNAMAIKDICVNELSVVNFACSLAGTVILGVVLTMAIARAFDNEKIMFNA